MLSGVARPLRWRGFVDRSIMERFRRMLLEIGWLWGLIFLANTALALVVSPLYFVMYPVLLTICIYFTYMRYDEHGEHKHK